jgi:hypothetical protein
MKPHSVLVHAGTQWFCIACNRALQEVPGDPRLLTCLGKKCAHKGWLLVRPDLASCEVLTP